MNWILIALLGYVVLQLAVVFLMARKPLSEIPKATQWLDSLQSLLVRTDSDIKSIDDLDGKNVGVQQGTTGETYAGENAPGAQLVQYPSDGELWPAMQAGQIDAILQDQPVNYVHEQDDPDYKIVETYPTDESYGFAFAKGEKDELRDAVNKALKELQDDGGYQKIYDKYLAAK